jgi:hypothetical protein
MWRPIRHEQHFLRYCPEIVERRIGGVACPRRRKIQFWMRMLPLTGAAGAVNGLLEAGFRRWALAFLPDIC